MNEQRLRAIIREELSELLADSKQQGMTPAEAAKYLGVMTSTLAVWRSQGRGPAYCKAGGIRYLVRDLNAWINQNRIGRGV